MPRKLEARRRRAAFRAHHRGTKEMDFLLGRFADARLAEMPAIELNRFEQLLAVADPELHSWIMAAGAQPGGEFAVLIEELRTFHNLTGSRA